jgi:hypothetical protein
MVFCGQCGLQLAPESTTCPRCGSVTEPDLSIEDPHLNDPTILTSFPAPQTPHPPVSEVQHPPVSPIPQQPQRLILRPESNPGYRTPTPYEPTSMMTTPVSPPQSGGTYPTQPAPYAGYQSLPGQFDIGEPLPSRRRGRGRIVALLSTLIILLLLLGTIAAVALNPGLLKGILGRGPTPTPIVSPTVLTASDHARAVMNEYYNDINTQNYQGAYNLWGNDFQNTHKLSDFEAGYAHTHHDDLTINSLTPLADGTVSADITIKATEDAASGGTVVSVYHGIYIVGQENGVWKILSGNFQKVG